MANSALAAVRIANTDDWPAANRSQEEIDALVEKMGYDGAMALGAKVRNYLSARVDQLRPEAKDWLARMKASWDEVL